MNLLDALCPGRRLRRIERQLDAEERVAVARMKAEWMENDRRRILENFQEPLFARRFAIGASAGNAAGNVGNSEEAPE